jgi:DNA-directed RNA polymerase specialized sigma24 family protein
MASWMPDTERERELLSRTIVRTLDSWPETHRRIFAEIHYRGKSIESVASAFAMQQSEVYALLEECERKLRHSLRLLRVKQGSGVSGQWSVNRLAPAFKIPA